MDEPMDRAGIEELSRESPEHRLGGASPGAPCDEPASWSPLRFIQQFGPGRPWSRMCPSPSSSSSSSSSPSAMVPQLLLFLLSASTVFRIAESCSSRSTPKPRPTSATMRPNITFQTYACPEAYAKWYCLNGATCFAVKIRDSILYNCECADGYMGQRCEFKDLDGSYLPSRERVMIERASIAGGVTIAVLLVVLISLAFYIHIRRRSRRKYSAYYPERSKQHLVMVQRHPSTTLNSWTKACPPQSCGPLRPFSPVTASRPPTAPPIVTQMR